MNHSNHYLLSLFFLFFSLGEIDAAIFTSTQDGNWNTASTWGGVSTPAASDTIIIQSGHTVTITGSAYTHTGNILIEDGGRLTIDCGNTSDAFIFNGGEFHVFGSFITTTSPAKDIEISGNSLFWVHDGSEMIVTDDLKFEGNSTNIVENVCIEVDDDVHINGTNTTLCGSGGTSLGTNTSSNTLNFSGGANASQICIGTAVFRGSGGNCTTMVTPGSGNNEPVAIDDSATANQDEGTTIDVLNLGTADSDADGDQLQLFYASGIYKTGSTSNGGTVSINDNGTPTNFADDFIDYTPPGGFTGDDTFLYTIMDGNGGMSTGTVTVTVSSVLPVTLIEFEANEINCQVQLVWSTANETDNQGFEIEKSSNGISWTTIAELQGAGTTNQTTHYQHLDKQIQRVNYYRLKQQDFDGKLNYSETILVEAKCFENIALQRGILSVIPNPVTQNQVKIIYDTPEAETELLVLTDLQGQILQKTIIEFEMGVNNVHLNLYQLPTGTYFLKIGKSQYKLVKLYD